MAVDVLIFGAHPDDVEWGAGGLLLLLQKRGVSAAIVDFTAGEMGSRGTPPERAEEAAAASRYLGATDRICLGMPDAGLMDSPEARRAVASVLRQYAPQMVLAPFWEDRHPDHAAAGTIVRNSALYAGMNKLESEFSPHKPHTFLYYLLHNYSKPSFVVDISSVYEDKLHLMRLHKSQFGKTAEEFGVVAHGSNNYLQGLESRDRFFGSLIGASHGEALVLDRPLALRNPESLLKL
jgi:N-acetylglucosamine malate deacetylase 1